MSTKIRDLWRQSREFLKRSSRVDHRGEERRLLLPRELCYKIDQSRVSSTFPIEKEIRLAILETAQSDLTSLRIDEMTHLTQNPTLTQHVGKR